MIVGYRAVTKLQHFRDTTLLDRMALYFTVVYPIRVVDFGTATVIISSLIVQI